MFLSISPSLYTSPITTSLSPLSISPLTKSPVSLGHFSLYHTSTYSISLYYPSVSHCLNSQFTLPFVCYLISPRGLSFFLPLLPIPSLTILLFSQDLFFSIITSIHFDILLYFNSSSLSHLFLYLNSVSA